MLLPIPEIFQSLPTSRMVSELWGLVRGGTNFHKVSVVLWPWPRTLRSFFLARFKSKFWPIFAEKSVYNIYNLQNDIIDHFSCVSFYWQTNYHLSSILGKLEYWSKEELLFSLSPFLLFNSPNGADCPERGLIDFSFVKMSSSSDLVSSFTPVPFSGAIAPIVFGIALIIAKVQTCSCLSKGALFLNLLPHPRPHNK